MKICVLGDSHLAAFKLAWDELKGMWQANTELEFYGIAGADFISKVFLEDRCLVPKTEGGKRSFYNTSGGQEKLDISSYDAAIIVGLDCKINYLSDVFTTHKTYDMPPSSSSYNNHVISLSCLTQVSMDSIRHSSMFQIAGLIRSIVEIPIYVVPCPLPSVECLNDTSVKSYSLSLNACESVLSCYYKSISDICNIHCAIFIPQPISTIERFIFTRNTFSRGSVRLGGNLKTMHPDNDYAHMNKEYGKVYLKSILQAM